MLFSSSGSAPRVTAILIGASTFSSQKSVSASISDRRAPMEKSIASSTVDLPLSPGPMRQLTPGLGIQRSALTPRKFSISTARISVMPPLDRRPAAPGAREHGRPTPC